MKQRTSIPLNWDKEKVEEIQHFFDLFPPLTLSQYLQTLTQCFMESNLGDRDDKAVLIVLKDFTDLVHKLTDCDAKGINERAEGKGANAYISNIDVRWTISNNIRIERFLKKYSPTIIIRVLQKLSFIYVISNISFGENIGDKDMMKAINWLISLLYTFNDELISLHGEAA
ncbi:MAG: hypothetical protein P4L51_06325 [Puia sp.]|nr:hypothetical protein [Puia sp.]